MNSTEEFNSIEKNKIEKNIKKIDDILSSHELQLKSFDETLREAIPHVYKLIELGFPINRIEEILSKIDALFPGDNDHTAVPGGEEREQESELYTRPQPKRFEAVKEEDEQGMLYYEKYPFRNWGKIKEVGHVPLYTFIPKTKTGICRLIQWAKQEGKKVRVAGYRHSWSNLFSSEGEILISLLPLDIAEDLPARHPPMNPMQNQLEGISIVKQYEEHGKRKAWCKVGAATTNEHFRAWCLSAKAGDGNKQWAIPLNVIMVEITFGGSNAPICHGAGLQHKTLSDLVRAIEFVNCNGEIQVIDNPEQLKAAAGCFGLLGIVLSVTLEIDQMGYALMKPTKPAVTLAIPPLQEYVHKKLIPSEISIASQPSREAAQQDFYNHCEKDYYSEWFWFAFSRACWVNTWNLDGKPSEAKGYPWAPIVKMQEYGSYAVELCNSSVVKKLKRFPQIQALLFSEAAMLTLPGKGSQTTTFLPDALHFRRGIQNMYCLDMEVEIPIPPRPDDATKPDWSICQRAWWDAIISVYDFKQKNKFPMRLALEMRIMGSSEIWMAPQYGNHFGTCSIEILTFPQVNAQEWQDFMQYVWDKWNTYRYPDGSPIIVRPHWAKQWQGLMVNPPQTSQADIPIEDHLRDTVYAKNIEGLRAQFESIAKAGNFSVGDLHMFTNVFLERFFFNSPGKPAVPANMNTKRTVQDSDLQLAENQEESASPRITVEKCKYPPAQPSSSVKTPVTVNNVNLFHISKEKNSLSKEEATPMSQHPAI